MDMSVGYKGASLLFLVSFNFFYFIVNLPMFVLFIPALVLLYKVSGIKQSVTILLYCKDSICGIAVCQNVKLVMTSVATRSQEQ